MLRAITLVHKGAMDIAVHSVRSFSRHFSNAYTLTIHTDPSIDENDHRLLLEAADGMQVNIVASAERRDKVKQLLRLYPKTQALVSMGTFFTKLEVPMFEEAPYFFFDSDIIWLRPVTNLTPQKMLNAFSTESWTWYNGISNDKLWIKAQTPRRVNSGFHWLGQSFPYEKMEDMLAKAMFVPSGLAGDQEIFAYLYNEMEYYHPQDLKRSRVGSTYQLIEEECAALHFPGKMWLKHMDQIEQLPNVGSKQPGKIRYESAVALTAGELIRMKVQARMGNSTLLAKPLNVLRKLLRAYR